MMPASSPDHRQGHDHQGSLPERSPIRSDLAARLAAWEATAQDLERVDPGDFSLRVRTDWQTPTEIAEAIRAQLEEAAPDAQPAQVR